MGETLAGLEIDLRELQRMLEAEDLGVLDVAKGNMALAYSMILLTYGKSRQDDRTDASTAYLQIKGGPQGHPIYRDLDRVKLYMSKVKRAEEGASRIRMRRRPLPPS